MWQKLSRGLSIAIVLLVSGITDLVTGVFNFLAYSADIALCWFVNFVYLSTLEIA